jgi:plasmid stability protein
MAKETTMATLTIRRVPEAVVARIKDCAARKGHSMEEEVRELLKQRYAEREAVLERVQRRWSELPSVTTDEIDAWVLTGRE